MKENLLLKTNTINHQEFQNIMILLKEQVKKLQFIRVKKLIFKKNHQLKANILHHLKYHKYIIKQLIEQVTKSRTIQVRKIKDSHQ